MRQRGQGFRESSEQPLAKSGGHGDAIESEISAELERALLREQQSNRVEDESESDQEQVEHQEWRRTPKAWGDRGTSLRNTDGANFVHEQPHVRRQFQMQKLDFQQREIGLSNNAQALAHDGHHSDDEQERRKSVLVGTRSVGGVGLVPSSELQQPHTARVDGKHGGRSVAT